jgi:hypothetical protein
LSHKPSGTVTMIEGSPSENRHECSLCPALPPLALGFDVDFVCKCSERQRRAQFFRFVALQLTAAIGTARSVNLWEPFDGLNKSLRRRCFPVNLIVDVLAFVSDDISYNLVIDACMIKLVLHIMPKAVEREFCSMRPKFLINDLTHTTAYLAPKNIISSFIKIWEETVLFVVPCLRYMFQEAEIDQLRMNWDQKAGR